MTKKYAADKPSALLYANAHYPKMYHLRQSGRCACGESAAIAIRDEKLDLVELIVICESCHSAAPKQDRV